MNVLASETGSACGTLPRMTDRTEIHTDGSYNDRTDTGGWAAVVFRHTSGQQTGTTNQEMELRAIVEAVKMAEWPTTVVSDHEGIVGIARRGITPPVVAGLLGRALRCGSG